MKLFLVLGLFLILKGAESAQSVKPSFYAHTDPTDKKACLLVASKAPVTVTLVNKDTKTNVPKKSEINIKNVAVTCDKGVATKLTLPKTDGLELAFKFTDYKSKWTMEPEATIGTEEYVTKNQVISVSKSFSFSCQKYEIKLVPKKEKSGQYESVHVTLEGFQVQPFHNGTKMRFLDSDDCAVWFTLPIWSSLIVTLLLVTILYFGIIALMSISTPDRFENPKGRTLIITNFDE
ncbi:V-type proton ATPase subunit [Tyrophagus putrescentiae]|nr:V-type proton ATPase subunit [Tyrophagus putrescentiae]